LARRGTSLRYLSSSMRFISFCITQSKEHTHTHAHSRSHARARAHAHKSLVRSRTLLTARHNPQTDATDGDEPAA
jgi:hypothetical protein